MFGSILSRKLLTLPVGVIDVNGVCCPGLVDTYGSCCEAHHGLDALGRCCEKLG